MATVGVKGLSGDDHRLSVRLSPTLTVNLFSEEGAGVSHDVQSILTVGAYRLDLLGRYTYSIYVPVCSINR